MTLLQNILDLLRTEDAPVNNAGGGAVAGLGVGPEGEPGVNLKKKRTTDGDDPLVETAEFVGKANPKNAIYAKLMKKGKPIGPDLYELTGKHVTPEIRRSLSAGFARGPEETDSFYLKHKADVTGIPSDEGYILKDKRPAYIKRFGIKEDGLDAIQEAADDTFAGGDVMDVDLGRVMTALNPKKPWERFSKYVGIDEVGENIRVHARENWKKNIILRDAKTGIMTYLRRRK